MSTRLSPSPSVESPLGPSLRSPGTAAAPGPAGPPAAPAPPGVAGTHEAAGIVPGGRRSRRETVGLLMDLGRALHRFGAPSHRLEGALTRVAIRLGHEGQFFATPTAIFGAFGHGPTAETRLARMEGGDVDLGRLSDLDALLGASDRGEADVAEAHRRLEAILARPASYGPGIVVACYGLASAAAARFFGGGWREIVATALLGLLLGGLAIAAGRRPVLARVFEPLAAFLASFVATALASLLTPFSPYVATLGGLIILIPGLTLTVAMTEISTGHLVSGTARLTGAIVLFLTIGFGVALGSKVGGFVFGVPIVVEPLALPGATAWIALGVAPLAFTVLFRAHMRDAGWILLAGAVAFGGARLGAGLLGPQLGAFLGAFLVGAVGNGLARRLDRPACVPMLPGIMLLVPGSLGFASLSSLLANDVVSGVDTAFRMTIVAVALVTGLLMANVVVTPRRAL